MKTRDILAVFNRGRISRLALARTDVARVALSADVQTNWMPRRLGSMMVRPGLEYIGARAGNGRLVPFIFSRSDTAIIELTAGQMRVWDDGTSLVVRDAVTAVTTNGNFTTNLTGWTDDDEAGAASTWVAGQMQLVGTGFTSARRRQAVTIAGADIAKTHALRISVNRGPCYMRIGTTSGADDVFRQAVLRTGFHSIAFIPGATTVYIEFASSLKWPVLIESCNMEGVGVMVIDAPWADTAACKAVRWWQDGDVVFCGSAVQQRRIERRSNNSWSIVLFQADDGPFMTENVENITITPSAIAGQIILSASQGIFRSGHVGALFRLASQGQRVASSLVASSTFTNEIRVTGVDNDRIFTVARAGVWVGTLSLQRSLSEPGSWVTVATYTTNASISYDDGLDNSIAYYRIGFGAAAYTGGTADVSLEFSAGSITGTARVIAYISQIAVDAVVLDELGGTQATEVWFEGSWSADAGWPEAVAVTKDGRLMWSGGGYNYGSVPDLFTSYDPDVIGDSQPINRRVGSGVVGKTNWMLPLQHTIVGTDGGEYSVRSTSFDEPLTPSNYNAQARTTKGSVAVPAVIIDDEGFFVGSNGRQIYRLFYDAGSYGYLADDLTTLVPEIGEPSFSHAVGQRTPDLRLHGIRSDGTVGVLVRDAAEDVSCWVDVETDGDVEDACVLPGDIEDRVFYGTARTIGGVTVRYLERWAREDEARGGTVNKMGDAFKTGTGDVVGLSHLEGKTVVVWADGIDQGNATVTGGATGETFGQWMVGLGYEARYKSAKLAGQTSLGLSLTQRSRINRLGLVLADTHKQGLRYGPDFVTMDNLPLVVLGETVDPTGTWEIYDSDMVAFPGRWSTDNRLCLVGAAPRPCTVLAAVINIDRQDTD